LPRAAIKLLLGTSLHNLSQINKVNLITELLPFFPSCLLPQKPAMTTAKLTADRDRLDLSQLLQTLVAVKGGNFSVRLPVDYTGVAGKIADTLNDIIELNSKMAAELERISNVVGKDGKLTERASLGSASGGWVNCIDSVNHLISDLVQPNAETARVIRAVAKGDFSQTIATETEDKPLKGEFFQTAKVVNTMVAQLSSFASEVTHLASEVGTEGKLGGQAQVMGVEGTWKDLTDNVNSMAGNLTVQVRGIARVVTAVANGNLKRKLMLDAKGEIETLAETINETIDTLATFAEQVTTVAREVGIEGKLGGQAKVPGAAGTWRDLTDNVNELAANLTTQVRAIAEVAIAVTKGDLTRSIAVQAEGEVAVLKDNINQMIANLRETTQKNTEQDWLKTNLAKFTRMLQGQRDLETVSKSILSELAPLVGAQHGVFYIMETTDEKAPYLKLLSSYAYRQRKNLSNRFYLGEGLVGQCALEKERILLTQVPDDYIKISSGLGEATPFNAVVFPVLFESQVTAVIELASFQPFNEIHLTFFDQLTESIAIVLNTVAASMRTEELLSQSQSLAQELQTQQGELQATNQRLEQQAQTLKASEELLKKQQEQLRQTNEELEEKARLLSQQNQEVERKNGEIEQAKRSLEEKAEQLALTSQYKSEFLANMSHELRTPLNSLLVLAKLMSENLEHNLTQKQVEYVQTMYSAGSDLLGLINDILDLAKIESGTISVEIESMQFADLQNHLDRTFRQTARNKGLEFTINLDRRLPPSISTDTKRLQQVLKNLLFNAFKFTDRGRVSLAIEAAIHGWSPEIESLNRASFVVAFVVSDTGIGIASNKQKIIFEAFQQVDGTTSRKYGGTGLGLSISREIARLLGGEITLVSHLGHGSTIPQYYSMPAPSPLKSEPQHQSLPPVERHDRIHSHGQEVSPTVEPSYFSIPSDDRDRLQQGDRVMLIVEDDLNLARLELEIIREQGLKGLIATRSATAWTMAQQYQPAAIFLDICLPGDSGWTVLARLKHDPKLRHIPVTVITGLNERQRGQKLGAIAYYQKPISGEFFREILSNLKQYLDRPRKNLLLAIADDAQRQELTNSIAYDDVEITAIATAAGAKEALRSDRLFDCVVFALALPEMSDFALIEELQQEIATRKLPIVIYAQESLSDRQQTKLQRLSRALPIKVANSPERLFDDTALFLHRQSANLPEPKQRILENLRHRDLLLVGKKVLIIDDDVRNVFALTSMLERYQTSLS
jgi:signal transduction histidine kinase/CheY-like chemotaxis protein/methyl-accepting chemotaxis protein